MAVWIDEPIWPRHGTVFAHLVSDHDTTELHATARAAGLSPRSFDGDHYDVPQERYADVLRAGARPTSGTDLVRRLNASGLRIRKRRGDKAVGRVRGVRWASGDVVDADLILAERPADPVRVGMSMCFVQDAAGSFVAVWSPRRREWGSPGGWREPGESPAEGAAREIAEECGLVIDPDRLVPVGYERFTPVRIVWAGQEAVTQRPLMQLFGVRLPELAPPLTAEYDDQPAPRWCTRDELAQLCSELFWWPLVERLWP